MIDAEIYRSSPNRMDNDLNIFCHVAHHHSFTKAAHELNLSPPAVTKAIARLESRLNLTLFNRTTRVVTLTPAGETLAAGAARLHRDKQELIDQLTQTQTAPTGPLKVALPVSLGSQGRGRYSLTRAIAAFARQYPAITIQALLADHQVDLVRDQIDLAIRIAPLEDSTLKVRIIAPCPLVLVAAPTYIARTPPIRTVHDLKSHAWLANQNHTRPDQLRYQESDEVIKTINLSCTFASNNGDQLTTAALAGLGITLLPSLFIKDDLATGRLIQILPNLTLQPKRYLSLYYPAQETIPARLRVFIDFMVEWFQNCTAEEEK